tara:strand:- start:475 stop:858 length:384 start_codon:yes stop_codon:yes gene_type:complete
MINFVLRVATLGLLGKVKNKKEKFEDTEAFHLWSMIGSFGAFLTLHENKRTDRKMMVITHPNVVIIVYNLLISFVLSLTILGLIITIPARKNYKKYNARIPYMVYTVTFYAAMGVWAFMILGSIFGG